MSLFAWTLRVGVLCTVMAAGTLSAQQAVDVSVHEVAAAPYRARGDGQTAGDMTIEAGSNELRSAGRRFRARDAGKLVTVYGAGPSGRQLTTKIAAFVSPGTVRLAVRASTRVERGGALWGSDDRAAIQSAIDSASRLGGTVNLGSGEFVISGSLVDTARAIRIIGAGPSATTIHFLGEGPAFRVVPNWAAEDNGGTIAGVRIIGTPAASDGIYIADAIGFAIRDVVIWGFTGPDASGIHLDNTRRRDNAGRMMALWTERTVLDDVWLAASSKGVRFTVTGGTDSFGYTRLKNVKFNLANGAIGISAENNAHIYNSFFMVSGNVDAAPATFYSLSGSARIDQSYFVHEVEGGGEWTLVDAARGTLFSPTGFITHGSGTAIPPRIAGEGTIKLSSTAVFNAAEGIDMYGPLRLDGKEVLGPDKAGGLAWGGEVVDGHTFLTNGKPAWQIRPDGTLDGVAARDLIAARFRAGRGSRFDDSDRAIEPGRWGDGFRISDASGTDQAFSFAITAGRSPGTNPGVTITFKDGPWSSDATRRPVYLCERNDFSVPFGAPPHRIDASPVALTIHFNGTPVPGTTYRFTCIGFGS